MKDHVSDKPMNLLWIHVISVYDTKLHGEGQWILAEFHFIESPSQSRISDPVFSQSGVSCPTQMYCEQSKWVTMWKQQLASDVISWRMIIWVSKPLGFVNLTSPIA